MLIYRGYVIEWTTGGYHVTKDGVYIGFADTEENAYKLVDKHRIENK